MKIGQLMTLAALLYLPATAQAARLVSAPITVARESADGLSTREDAGYNYLTCSVRYLGKAASVTGRLQMWRGDATIGGGGVTLTQSARSWTLSGGGIAYPEFPHFRDGEAACEFTFPGQPASDFRAAACVSMASTPGSAAVCMPAW